MTVPNSRPHRPTSKTMPELHRTASLGNTRYARAIRRRKLIALGYSTTKVALILAKGLDEADRVIKAARPMQRASVGGMLDTGEVFDLVRGKPSPASVSSASTAGATGSSTSNLAKSSSTVQRQAESGLFLKQMAALGIDVKKTTAKRYGFGEPATSRTKLSPDAIVRIARAFSQA